ncbi:MAG: DUF4153 domain-containing protein [Azoarcus sp.]|jgi:hypothetical protein|nr:DUF4153 domain-containing protein [Azoarcus sp.]
MQANESVSVPDSSSGAVVERKQDSCAANSFASSMEEKLSLLVKRFPVSVLLIVGFAALCFTAINGRYFVSDRIWICFAVSALISVATTLFVEDIFDNIKTYVISFFVVLLFGVYCFFLPKDSQISKVIEVFAIGGTAFCSMLFISFLGKNKDRAFWNFSTQTVFQMMLACFFTGIIFGGLSLALSAIARLFEVWIVDKLVENLAVICFVLFAPLYFLANIPNKTEKHSEEISYSKILKILALYILTPILAVYAVILYVYLFKIVITWELPNGWVSRLVSALTLGGLLVVTLSYPIREQEENKIVNFVSRWFGLLVLPLLILMTIGIFRRISDYGITINRGYVLLLNFWFYGICIYLFLTQSRHIKWILISPVVVAFLTSISAWGVANVTQKSLIREVKAVFDKQVSYEAAREMFAKMTQKEKERIKSTLQYLHKNFGEKSVQPFFTDTLPKGKYWEFMAKLSSESVYESDENEIKERIVYSANRGKMWKIENYSIFTKIDFFSSVIKNSENNEVMLEFSEQGRTCSLSMKEILSVHSVENEKPLHEQEWIIRKNDCMVVISVLNATYYPEKDNITISSLEGYLFYK